MRSCLILDFGNAHVTRLAAALERAGQKVVVTTNPRDVRSADRLVLPSGDDDERALERGISPDVFDAVAQHVSAGRPLLAVGRSLHFFLAGRTHSAMPVGLQMFSVGIQHFDPRMADEHERPLKSPHAGYGFVVGLDRHPQFKKVVPSNAQGLWLYFRHRLCAPARVPFADVAVAHHGVPFAGAIWRDAVVATQFLPELSGNVGIELLRAWGDA